MHATPRDDAADTGSTPRRSGEDEVAATEVWHPMRTRVGRWSWGLLAVFTAIYFFVAIVTSAEFADLAAIMIMGLPLGFILGIGLIITGLVITRIYLARIER